MPTYEDLMPAEEVVEETPNEEEEFEDAESPEGDSDSEGDEGEGSSEEEAEGEGEGEAEGEEEPAPIGDGKRIPDELKELIKLHPDRAKLLKDLYFTNSRYSKMGKVADLQKLHDYVNSYGSLEDAQRVKEQLDSVGDLGEMVEGFQNYEKLNQQFTAGDPAYVDHLAQTNPDAFAKIAPAFLQRFGKDHGEQYNHLMAQVVVSTLINNGTANAMSLLQQAAASGNVEQVKQLAAQINEGLQTLNTISQRAPQIKTTDPRVAELEKQAAQLKQERQQQFVNDVKDRANTWASPMIASALKPFGKVKPEMMKRLDRDIKDSIGEILAQKPEFQAKIKAALSKGDKDRAMSLYQQYVTPLVTGASRKVAAIYGLKAAPKKGTPAPTGGTGRTSQNGKRPSVSAGFERVTTYPNVKDVKRDFDGYYEMAARDEFILKDGRKIKVVQ